MLSSDVRDSAGKGVFDKVELCGDLLVHISFGNTVGMESFHVVFFTFLLVYNNYINSAMCMDDTEKSTGIKV